MFDKEIYIYKKGSNINDIHKEDGGGVLEICHVFPILFSKQYIYCLFLRIEGEGLHYCPFLWTLSMHGTKKNIFDESHVENNRLTFINYGKTGTY